MSSSTMLPPLKDLWASCGIQLLAAATVACEIVLATLGSLRKYMTSIPVRIVIWAAYLLLPYFAIMALGKLTVVRIDDPENPGYDVVLEGLLAPLLLMQLGYADSITAYEVEDNRLGLRQVLSIVVTWGIVVWILIRCWDGSSPVSWLCWPLFVLGIRKSAAWVWALQSVYDENSSVTAEDINEENEIQTKFEEFPEDGKFASAKDILKAYFRFECLKPHLVNWLYHPVFISSHYMSIDDYSPNRAFAVTEIELNFMYDVLYSKAPVLYTKVALIGHFFGFSCLVSALCGFSIIFRTTFLIDMYVTYTYVLLMAVTSLELYQIMVLPFSDWAVVKMSMNLNRPLVRRILPSLADRCMHKKRWSRSIGQLNMLDRQFLHKKLSNPVDMVLGWFGKGEIFRNYRLHSRKPIPSYLKTLVVQKMVELDKQRHQKPFTERGKWTLETHGIQQNQKLDDSINTEFDKSIITWHIATGILHLVEGQDSEDREGSKLLSDYMIYILALHPYMLSLTTSEITLDYARCTLGSFLSYRDDKEAIIKLFLSWEGDITLSVQPSKETRITRDWKVLSDVRKLVVDLRRMENKWEIISSIWVEMLCYAAYHCHPYHHSNQLRRGGELITHVWLLLAHKTDKHNSSNDDFRNGTAGTSAPSTSTPRGKGRRSCIQRVFFGKGDPHIYDPQRRRMRQG